MKTNKYFCLKCYKVNACSCGTSKYLFIFTGKIRPPVIKNGKINKRKWQQFLIDCPQFINCVPKDLYEMFNDFVINKCGFKGTKINGRVLSLKRENYV